MPTTYSITCYDVNGNPVTEQDVAGLEQALATAKHAQFCVAFTLVPKPSPSYHYKLFKTGWSQLTPEGFRRWLERRHHLIKEQPDVQEV